MKVVHVAASADDVRRIAPVMEALRRSGDVTQSLVHTGPSLESVRDQDAELDLPRPSAHLGIGPASPAVQAGRALIVAEQALRHEAPDWVVTIGDAPAILGTALAAAQLGLRGARLEAGLRSHQPGRAEDLIRALVDRTAHALFTSEPAADENLAQEGAPAELVHRTGSLTIDVLERHLSRAEGIDFAGGLDLEPHRYLLVLLERPGRRENGTGLAALLEGLGDMAVETGTPTVLPLTPELAAAVRAERTETLFAPLLALGPVAYVERIALLARAGAVLTDSGPVQEEATTLGIPCLVPGRSTERPITVTRGTSRLVPEDGRNLGEVVRLALATPREPRRPELWDGRAAERVASLLVADSAFAAGRRLAASGARWT